MALAAGCGESRTTGTKTPTARPNTAPSSGDVPDEAHIGTVPKEVGLRLDPAEKDLNSKKVPYKVIGGGSSGVVKSDWTVCEMIPLPRTHLEFGTTIRLIVGRSC